MPYIYILKYLGQRWQAGVQVEERQEDRVWIGLWKTQLPLVVQEFIYKLLWKKSHWRIG